MRKHSVILYFSLIIFSFSCIQEYVPKLNNNEEHKIVVYGNITDKEGYQTITISMSSNTYLPQYTPITNCLVTIDDDNGNTFQGEENNLGEYKVWIDQSYLSIGTSYKLDIILPNGDHISSEFDIMTKSANLDSIYYIKEQLLTKDPKLSYNGIQFYTNLKGEGGEARFYKYSLTETWEYHSAYPRQATYDKTGTLNLILPVDSSKMVCWKTKKVNGIYVLSLENLSEIEYEMNKLNFIKDNDERRSYGYSLLVEQLSLSESAFRYHNKIKNNNYDNEGLYEQQPAIAKGNLTNLTNPDQEVLGFFFASSIISKRIFVEKNDDESIVYNNMCDEKILWRGLRSVPWNVRPAYILLYEGYPTHWLNDECVDCTIRGGVLEKPNFWPINLNNNK